MTPPPTKNFQSRRRGAVSAEVVTYDDVKNYVKKVNSVGCCYCGQLVLIACDAPVYLNCPFSPSMPVALSDLVMAGWCFPLLFVGYVTFSFSSIGRLVSCTFATVSTRLTSPTMLVTLLVVPR